MRFFFFFLLTFIIFLFIVIPIVCCVFPRKVTSPSFYWCIKLLWTFWLCIQTFQVELNLFSFSTYIFFSCYSFFTLFSLFYISSCSISSFCFLVLQVCFVVVLSHLRLVFAIASWVSYNNILSSNMSLVPTTTPWVSNPMLVLVVVFFIFHPKLVLVTIYNLARP